VEEIQHTVRWDDDEERRINNSKRIQQPQQKAAIKVTRSPSSSRRGATRTKSSETTTATTTTKKNKEKTNRKTKATSTNQVPIVTASAAVPKVVVEHDKIQRHRKRKTTTKMMKTTTRRANGMNIPYEDTFKALQVFHKRHGHVILPRRYPVEPLVGPSSTSSDEPEAGDDIDEDYPNIWHGVDLAGTVYNMPWWQKHIKHRPDRVADLNTLGFVWERLQPEWNLILESLIVYRSIYGDLLVKTDFTVPYDDDNWPKSCWGIALGTAVNKIRTRGDHLRDHHSWERREQLDSIGFVWDTKEVRFNKFCHALRIYRQIHHGPDDLGVIVGGGGTKNQVGKNLIRDATTSLARQATIRPSSNLIGSNAAGGRYDSGGTIDPVTPLRVPSKFRIPRSSRWPNYLWGYPLGERCTQVRQKQLYIKDNPRRFQELANLGFFASSSSSSKGGNSDLSWLKVVHASAVYSQLHDNILDVPTKYVVPFPPEKNQKTISSSSSSLIPKEQNGSDDALAWPEYLWGYPLGQRLRDVRVKGYHLNGPQADERRRQLDALGMQWTLKRGPRPTKTTPL